MEETELANIRSSFDRASLSDKHTLWGASNKKIEWDNPQSIKRDSLATYIRVRVQDSISLGIKSGGENQFYQIWLKATKKVDNKNTYSLSYLTLITNEQADKFTGLIFSEDILNKATSYTTFVEGKAVRKNNKDILLKGSNKSYLSYECQHIWAIVNDSWHSRQTCQWTVDPNRPITEEAFDPDGLEGGGASGGGGGGGGGGASAPQEVVDNYNAHIDDSELPECMKGILQNLLSIPDCTIGDMINKFAGNVPGYNLKFEQIYDDNPLRVAWVNTVMDDGYVTINFNSNSGTQQNVTDLALAATILHEGIHAYLFAYYQYDPSAAGRSYPQLFTKFTEARALENRVQHNFFAQNFMAEMETALTRFGQARGYQYDPQIYKDLAWKGLTETYNFIRKSPTDQQRILDRIKSEQWGINHNDTTQKGTKAGC